MLYLAKNSEHVRGDSSHISQIHQTDDYYIVESRTSRNLVWQLQYILIDKKTFQAASPPQTSASTPNPELPTTNFTATLPNGVAVELVGLCEHPSEGKQWWRPNGLLLEQKLYNKLGFLATSTTHQYYEIALKVSNVNESLSITSDRGDCGFNNYGENIWASAICFEKDKTQTDIRLGFSTGTWTTIATSEPESSSGTGKIGFGKAFETELKSIGKAIGVTATYETNKNVEIRIIAMDRNGNAHTSCDSQGIGGEKWLQTTVHFKNLSIAQVSNFQFQTRSYEWITFKNVSLRPGVKTDVKIEAEKPEVENRESEAKPEVPLDPKSIQTVTFMKDMPLTEALRMLSKMYKVNIIPSQEAANSRWKIGVTHLYDVNFEQILKAVCGTTCTYEIKDDFIHVYTNEEYKAVAPNK